MVLPGQADPAEPSGPVNAASKRERQRLLLCVLPLPAHAPFPFLHHHLLSSLSLSLFLFFSILCLPTAKTCEADSSPFTNTESPRWHKALVHFKPVLWGRTDVSLLMDRRVDGCFVHMKSSPCQNHYQLSGSFASSMLG